MEVHRAFRLARGARREGDEADVVGRGVDGFEVRARLGHQGFERIRAASAPGDDALEAGCQGAGPLHVVGEAVIAERQRDACLVQRIGDLACPQQRHGGHHHASRLEHREIGRRHGDGIGRAQQHPVARDEAQAAYEHVGDAVYPLVQFEVGEALLLPDQAGRMPMPLRHPTVEQRRHAVQPRWLAELRQGEEKVRPEVAWREVIAGEGIDVSGLGHGSAPLADDGRETAVQSDSLSLKHQVMPGEIGVEDGQRGRWLEVGPTRPAFWRRGPAPGRHGSRG